MPGNFTNKHDVVIAGAGIAAALTAIRLLEYGFRPLILARRLRPAHGAEAIPESVLRWQRLIDVAALLKQAGAVATEGFEVDSGNKEGFKKAGTVFHVERVALARVALASAVNRGASLVYCEKLPNPVSEEGSIKIVLENRTRAFRFAIDATGRSACWSRPVKRLGDSLARLFRLPNNGNAMRRGKIVVMGGKKRAYRIDLPDEITVGIVGAPQFNRDCADQDVLEKLQLNRTLGKPFINRPALPQAAVEVCKDNRISVGDAAFAHNPIAGLGVCAALSNAAAASDVLHTCREMPQNQNLAFDYYRELIDAEKRRHLTFLETFESEENNSEKAKEQINPLNLSPTTKVRLSAPIEITGVKRDGFILPEEALSLPGGGKVRWLGEFDLLQLKQICLNPVSLSELLKFLSATNLPQNKAVELIGWCFRNDVLSITD